MEGQRGTHKPLSGLSAKGNCSSQLIGALRTEGLRTSHRGPRAILHPSQSAWGGVQILVFLKVPGGPSDLPRLTNCRRLDLFQGWFPKLALRSGRAPPVAGTSGCGRDRKRTWASPRPTSALHCTLHASETPKRDARIPRQEQSRWLPALAVGPKAAPPQACSGRQRLGVGAVRPRAAGGRLG